MNRQNSIMNLVDLYPEARYGNINIRHEKLFEIENINKSGQMMFLRLKNYKFVPFTSLTTY